MVHDVHLSRFVGLGVHSVSGIPLETERYEVGQVGMVSSGKIGLEE